MRRFGLGVVAGVGCVLAGCWTDQQQSVIAPYVRDIRIQPNTLIVDSCALTYTKTTSHHWLTGIFGNGSTSDTSSALTEGGCLEQTTYIGGRP